MVKKVRGLPAATSVAFSPRDIEEPPLFCPACGMKLLKLARSLDHAESYYICGKCEALLQRHGLPQRHGSDYNFKILGTITDESLAMLIADSLKGEDP